MTTTPQQPAGLSDSQIDAITEAQWGSGAMLAAHRTAARAYLRAQAMQQVSDFGQWQEAVERVAVLEAELAGLREAARMTPDHLALAKFYNVTTYAGLAQAQAYHIEKLQAKLPPTPNVFAPQRAREG